MDENIMFKERIRELRIDSGLKQKELAKVLNYGESTISNYENGHNTPSYQDLIKIAKEFDVSIDYLLGATDIKTKFGSGSEMSDTQEQLIKQVSDMDKQQTNEIFLFIEWLKYRNSSFIDQDEYELEFISEENNVPFKVAQNKRVRYTTKSKPPKV